MKCIALPGHATLTTFLTPGVGQRGLLALSVVKPNLEIWHVTVFKGSISIFKKVE